MALRAGDITQIPRVIYDDDDLYNSGARIVWLSESQLMAGISHRTTDAIIGLHSIPVGGARANTMIEDSAFAGAGFVAETLGEAYAAREEGAFLDGTGVHTPLGMLLRR